MMPAFASFRYSSDFSLVPSGGNVMRDMIFSPDCQSFTLQPFDQPVTFFERFVRNPDFVPKHADLLCDDGLCWREQTVRRAVEQLACFAAQVRRVLCDKTTGHIQASQLGIICVALGSDFGQPSEQCGEGIGCGSSGGGFGFRCQLHVLSFPQLVGAKNY
jgi:hypothetical protein